ncbi:hypothetical protein [Shewanella sp. Isolate11]|uniref:hypothetical protein n=1 Tax=Shewanella sp. Isolate11 TaxID=2908530 RepID=UPI001EFDCF61|nr:hypothetical protein [Shewanella sp. Isolate11]MCG9698028.1 hypothetical protein [Shewanella sp. Isolate11]
MTRKTRGPFDWINFANKEMVKWAKQYFLEKGVLIQEPLNSTSFQQGLDIYKASYGNELLLVRNMKDAWRGVLQRKSNLSKNRVSITHSISSTHNRQLRKLASTKGTPINKTLESLIDGNYSKLQEEKLPKSNKNQQNTPENYSLINLNNVIIKKEKEINELKKRLGELENLNNELLNLIQRASSLLNKKEKKIYLQIKAKLTQLENQQG